MNIQDRHLSAQIAVLAWYDGAARDLPWRVTPQARKASARSNPYHVWLSEMMLQQTTVLTVKPYFEKFTSLWPTVTDLAQADRDDVMAAWAGLGYYARARNLHKAALIVADEFGGTFPEDEKTLLRLPGVGAYTAAAITAFAFGHHAVVVDGNIERVTARWNKIEDPLPKARSDCYKAMAALTPKGDPLGSGISKPDFLAGDFAQALMDIGASICTAPRKSGTDVTAPSCLICPLAQTCAAKDHDPARFPIKIAKKPRPDRFGHVLIIKDDDGHVVLTLRPDKGLLGGLYLFPTNDWPDGGGKSEVSGKIKNGHPAHMLRDMTGQGSVLNTIVSHIFSHFRVLITVEVIHLKTTKPDLPTIDEFSLKWVKINELATHAIPTVMVKCAKAAQLL